MRTTTITWLAAIAILCGSVFFAIFLARTPLAPSEKPLVIGAILPLTGKTAFLGEEERKGIEAAKALLHDKGISTEVVYEDSMNAAKQGLSAFQKLISSGDVDGIIITHSGVLGPISEYIASQGARGEQFPPIIGTIVASTKITRNNDVTLRCYPSGEDEAGAVAHYAIDALGLKTAAVVFQNDDYGLDGRAQFSKIFQSLNRKVVLSEALDSAMPDQRSLAAKVAAANPDGVYVIGNTPAYATSIRQIREAGYKGVILSGSAVDVVSLRKAIGNESISGSIFSSTFMESEALTKTGTYLALKAALASQGATPNMLTIYSAVSLQVLAELLARAPAVPLSAQLGSLQTTSFDTALGTVRFDKNRDAILPLFLKKAVGVDPEADILLKAIIPPQ